MSCALSIIIVNWNVADLLINTIQSIFNHPPARGFEIIVVDNASTDDSLLRVHQLFPMVKVIANPQNVGFSRANNQGMEIASGDYIFLLNPDTIVVGDALNLMQSFLENHSDYGMVGPQLVTHEGLEPMLASAKLSRTFLSGVLLDLIYLRNVPYLGPVALKKLRYPYDLNKEFSVEVISGAAMMFRAATVKEIGGLDERFFMAGEDVEFCDRIRNHGLKIHYYPEAKIIHLEQSCTPKNPVDIFINRFMSVARYYDLKYGKTTHLFYRISAYIILLPKFILKSIYYFIRGKANISHMNLLMMKKMIKWKFVGDADFLNQ